MFTEIQVKVMQDIKLKAQRENGLGYIFMLLSLQWSKMTSNLTHTARLMHPFFFLLAHELP